MPTVVRVDEETYERIANLVRVITDNGWQAVGVHRSDVGVSMSAVVEEAVRLFADRTIMPRARK